MPVIHSTYNPPFGFRSGDIQTIYASLIRRLPPIPFQRIAIDTPDGDFLNCDWSRVGGARVAILSHGLEGHTNRRYIRGMTHALNNAGWDVLAWNFRYCGGGPNHTFRMTHNGSTNDLHCVIEHALASDSKYKELGLVGFSMGGNITLLYLGQNAGRLPDKLTRAMCISVPCHLAGCARRLAKPRNRMYLHKFLSTMKPKIKILNEKHGNIFNTNHMNDIKDFESFDDRFTAPMHGFKNADDYYTKCSSLSILNKIDIPTLMLSAKNDSFLSSKCFPYQIAQHNPFLYLETPKFGGHVGFVQFNRNRLYYSEKRALEFF